MAHVHVLDNPSEGGDNYNAVVHIPMPTGNNAVGVPWKTCWKASWNDVLPASVLLTTTQQGGNATNDPGKITATEAGQIAQGDIIEEPFIFTDDATLSQAQRDAIIDSVALSAQTRRLANLKTRFKFYGYTRP